MKLLSVLFCMAAAALPLNANLVITEIMSSSGHTGVSRADWWELSNSGTATLDLTGYSWDDDKRRPGAVPIPAGTLIGPGESILFAQIAAGDVAQFRAEWGLAAGLQIIPHAGPGLGNGDEVNLYDASGTLVASAVYPNHQSGVSRFWFTDGSTTTTGFSVAGQFGAWVAPFDGANQGSDVASPGVATPVPLSLPPVFTSPDRVYGRHGFALDSSGFIIIAEDPNPQDRLFITAISKPDWVVIFDLGDGTALLGSNDVLGAEQVGIHSIELQVRDNSPQQYVARQTLSLRVFRNDSPVIVNEFNAVRADRWLEVDGQDASTRADLFFGRVAGNGGNWVELAVLGDGSAGSTVDMRGWTLAFSDNGAPYETLVLSEAGYWANVVAGTLLTFTDSESAGGQDTRTAINRINRMASEGWAWSHVFSGDPFLIDRTRSSSDGRFAVSHEDTLIAIYDRNGDEIFGPAGESVVANFSDGRPSLLGLSSREVFKLESDPILGGFFPDPYFANFKDGTSSSFGTPNTWRGGDAVQDFSRFITANSAPAFTSTPPLQANVGLPYIYPIQLSSAATLTASRADGTPLPPWLQLNGTTLSGTPGSGDYGYLDVLISAAVGGSVTPQYFLLTVFPASPSVILNEFNAVSSSNFLNGGDSVADSSGTPPAQDTHFGRIQGNGGDWFELVVVGNGGLSTVDLRGWRIEITDNATVPFDASDVIVLSTHPFWAEVPAGTILTFTEDNSSHGGLDTRLAANDRFATQGYRWSNVWLGDANLIDFSRSSGFTVNSADGSVSGVTINHENTQFLIKDANGRWVFGPVGEGIAPVSGIQSTHVFELEGHPSPAVLPNVSASDLPYREGYDTGVNESTFGSPNYWQGSDFSQDFTPWVNTAPQFILPQSLLIPANAAFSLDVLASDDGPASALRFRIDEAPAWLDLSNLLDGNARLSGTAPPAASFAILLSVSDGHLRSQRQFDLTVSDAVLSVWDHATPDPKGSDFVYLPWFGWFVPYPQWIYHPDLGWWFVGDSSPAEGFYYFDFLHHTWAWTSPQIHPIAYHFSPAQGWVLP